MRRYARTTAAFFLAVLFASTARAEKILLVDDPDTQKIGARLRAELVAGARDRKVQLARPLRQ